MVFGLMQMALGVALCAAGPLLGGPAWAFAWPGISVFVVGLGYVALGPRVLGKRARDGSISPLFLALLFPYFAVAWTLWQLKSRLRSEAAWHEVAPGLYVGRRPLDEGEMPSAPIVVDMTAEFPRAPATRHAARYVCIPVLDTSAPDAAQIDGLLADLERATEPIFVHCAMGHGRSATIAAALLVRRGDCADVAAAIARMRAHRPGIYLHAGQRAIAERAARRAD